MTVMWPIACNVFIGYFFGPPRKRPLIPQQLHGDSSTTKSIRILTTLKKVLPSKYSSIYPLLWGIFSFLLSRAEENNTVSAKGA